MINAEVQRTGSENVLATIRKFSRRVQGTGLIKTVRKRRYYARDASKIVKKKHALKLIKRREEYFQAVKEGKITETPRRGAPQNREQSGSNRGGLGESTPIAR